MSKGPGPKGTEKKEKNRKKRREKRKRKEEKRKKEKKERTKERKKSERKKDTFQIPRHGLNTIYPQNFMKIACFYDFLRKNQFWPIFYTQNGHFSIFVGALSL